MAWSMWFVKLTVAAGLVSERWGAWAGYNSAETKPEGCSYSSGLPLCRKAASYECASGT